MCSNCLSMTLRNTAAGRSIRGQPIMEGSGWPIVQTAASDHILLKENGKISRL